MTKKVFQELREQLDQYSMGFPSTQSGVEIRILQKLFSEDEAALFLNLNTIFESPHAIAQRCGLPMNKVSEMLEKMETKGLIVGSKKQNEIEYRAIPFVIGINEHQINTVDREFAELFDKYMVEGFGKTASMNIAPLRTIPINKSIDYSWQIAPYEDIRWLVNGSDKISVGKCICRLQQRLLDKGCGKPLETCFKFGDHADYYVEKGMGRFITKDEALKILEACDDAGLVPMPWISKERGSLCNCCGDCCGILRGLKMNPRPVEKIVSNYFAVVDPNACTGCGSCEDRCQMDAIKVGDSDVAEVDLDRCIGCGLCVPTCPSEALSLHQKSASERLEPPETGQQYLIQLSKSRGKSLVPIKITEVSS